MTSTVLITGASGFVGRHLTASLAAHGRALPLACARQRPAILPAGAEFHLAPELSADADWRPLLGGVQAVIHCAAHVHVMGRETAASRAAFLRINVDGTRKLAVDAAAAGVRRLVFLSSAKVNGELTVPGQAFTAEDSPRPSGAYAESKAAAETQLRQIASETGLELVIVRAPLVYGPGVKANFASMMAWIRRGVPLPLGAIDNRRSLLGLDNLVDLLERCLEHPAAAGQTFMASDGEDVATPELLRRLAAAMQRPVRLVPVAERWLRIAARSVGRGAVAERLCGSLQLDIGKTRDLLHWTPPVPLDEGLRRVVRGQPDVAG